MGLRFTTLALLLAACGAPTPEACDAGCAVTLELGAATDDAGFVALADGDPVVMHQGPQGGFHVFAAARATGLQRQGPLVFELRQDGGVLAHQVLDLGAVQLESRDCGWERSRTVLFLVPIDVTPLRNTEATLHLDTAGRTTQRRVRLE